MELWDIYDINRNKLEKTIDRHSEQRLKKGEYHLVVEAIILNQNNQILISRRSNNKKKYPMLWECNGGSVKSGEESIEAIKREIFEELGLEFDDKDLTLYKEIRDDEAQYFKDVWLIKKDIDINKIWFRDCEVVEVKWATIEELEYLKKMNVIVPKLLLNREEFNKIINKVRSSI